MIQMAPPNCPPRVALGDSDGHGLSRVRFRLWQILWTAVTVAVTVRLCTFGWIPAILALMVAKHILVAIVVMGLGVDAKQRV